MAPEPTRADPQKVELVMIGEIWINFRWIVEHLNEYLSVSDRDDREDMSLEKMIQDFVLARTNFEEMIVKLLSHGWNSAEVKNLLVPDDNSITIWKNGYAIRAAHNQIEGDHQEYMAALKTVQNILLEFQEDVEDLHPVTVSTGTPIGSSGKRFLK